MVKPLKIAVIEGDGIGKEVIPAAIQVLDALSLPVEKVPLKIGYEKWEQTGSAITQADIDLLKECDCILFGAITTPNDPDYKSVLLTIRKNLDMYANIRPIKPIPGINGITNRNDFDVIIVRENTEGMYSGIEEINEDRAYTKRVVTREGSRRIADYASKIAKKRRHQLEIVHKSNVLKSDKLFLDVCKDVASNYNLQCHDTLIDSMAYNLICYPDRYDVIVTTNIFGDILSDMAAALVGSLGLMPSANIGEKHAFFEPVHGSAPDIAGKGIANPIAAILSLKMMLEWYGLYDQALIIQHAIEYSISNNFTTPDLGGTATTQEVGAFIAQYTKRSNI